MIDESIKIKLNQFMLTYERQCVELQFQKQNIKQNVMLSIIESKNAKKNSISTINNSLEKSMVKSKVHQNLVNSKQIKFSEQKETTDSNKYPDTNINGHDNNNFEETMQRSNVKQNSRHFERSNISARENRSHLLRNNFVDKNPDEKVEQYQQKMIRSQKSGLYNNSYYKQRNNKELQIQYMENEEQIQKSQIKDAINYNKKLGNFVENDKKMTESKLKEQQGLGESCISRKSQTRIDQKRYEKQLEEAYSGEESGQFGQSGVIGKRSLRGSKVYAKSQKAIAKQSTSSLVERQQQYSNQEGQQQQQQQQLQNYPTFKKPSFKFITNLSQLRQSTNNPQQKNQYQQQKYDPEEEDEGQEEEDYLQYPQQQRYAKQYEEQLNRSQHVKWNSNRSKDNNEDWNNDEKQEEENQYQGQQQQQQEEQQNQQSFGNPSQQSIFTRNNNQSSSLISNIKQDQSMLIPSQYKQKSSQQSRKSYMAFEINMEKSNLPNNQSIEDLKKKKILQLERKRLERIENNSRRKPNPSEVNTPNSKQQQKLISSPFIASSRQNQRKQVDNNRDSLNKSINDRKQQRTKILKTSAYREQQASHKESTLKDNRTIMTKYGEQSRMSNNNRPMSPLNTVKTTHMNTIDKRPPLNKNRRQDNIFAGESGGFQRDKVQPGYQRERSAHKVSDPKIVPIDRKNSFQKKSNIKLMTNAITYTCLPGELNRREREKLIDILDDYESEFMIFLFKEYSRKVIKGIYILQSGQDRIVKIYGEKAPVEIFPQQVHEFYRFDSASRQFKKIDGCKSFSFSVHAVDLK